MARKLAASFIVVVAGCGGARHINPPPPNPPAPDPPHVLVEPENTADPKWTDPPDPTAGLPDAPPDKSVTRRPDGTCFYYGDMPKFECPPPDEATCNPPPPVVHDVKCPPEN